MKFREVLLLAFLLMGVCLQGQSEKKRIAKEFFFNGKYEEARSLLSRSRDLVDSDQEAKYLLALSHFQLNQLEEAERWLTQLVDGNKVPYSECWFYFGRIYHARHQFAEAANYYKTYLRSIRGGHPNRRMVIDMLKRCSNGLQLQYNKPYAFVENLGNRINTSGDEYAPILSPNFEDKIYFTSVREGNMGGPRSRTGTRDEQYGQYYSDIYFGNNKQGIWADVDPMDYLRNSPSNDILLGFDYWGSVLYYFKGYTFEQGQFMVDTFRQEDKRRLSSDPFIGPLDPSLGDATPHFFSNERVVFSSRRPGGYGGLDLYEIRFRNGRWSSPRNLGSEVNTPYDETTPFMANDGKTLYYSTNHPTKSMGGLDVVRAAYNPFNNSWTQPENMGMPINSAGDDAYFKIAKDGITAYFSSSRKDGFGQRDIYAAYFNSFLEEMEVPAGFVPPRRYNTDRISLLEEPGASSPNVVVPYEENHEEIEVLPENYFYLNEYYEPLVGDQVLDEMVGLFQKDPSSTLVITAYSNRGSDNAQKMSNAIQAAAVIGQKLMQRGIPDNKIFTRGSHLSTIDITKPYGIDFAFTKPPLSVAILPVLSLEYQTVAENKALNESLIYKIQIAASSKASYNREAIERNPFPMVEKRPDNKYFRYTVGAFNSFYEADRFREKLISQGINGAFVVPYIYGVRQDKQSVKLYSREFPDLSAYLNNK
ncbi:MAG: tetratricopeptide repeat protein [Saprospiraceae bacterium]|nr:tetratricopeptide repeat protein [Saprospiraceae bacterium]